MLKADQSGLGIMVPVAAEIKKAVSIPVGAVTYMDPARDPEFFESLIASGELDFILMNPTAVGGLRLPAQAGRGPHR